MNVVEILIRASNQTGKAFAEADAEAGAMGRKMQKIGLIASGALLAIGFEAVRMGAKFDSAMTMLVTQAGVAPGKLKGLEAGVLALAGQVGFSPDSLAESLYHVESNFQSMGITGPKALHLVKIAAEGAAIGHANLVDVTNALTAAIASGIPGVKNMGQAMGMLNKIVGVGDMHMQDLAEAFGSGMVAVVKGYGLSLKDVGAALAVFGDNNIRGAHAGTMLRMAVQALAVPAKAGVSELQKIGMTSTTLATDMRKGGLLKAIDDLKTHFEKAGITAKEQGQIITTIFGKKAGAGIAVLMDQTEKLRSKYKELGKGASGFSKAWDATKQTFTQQMHEMGASVDSLMISLGNKLIPVVQSVVGWMLKHKQVVLDVIIAVGALAVALGVYATVVKIVEIVTAKWAAIQAILDGELSANPIGLIVVAVAALVLGIIYCYKHFETFRDIVKTVGRVAVDVFKAIAHFITNDVIPVLKDIAKVAVETFKGIIRIVGDVITWVKDHWKFLLIVLTGPIGLAVVWIVDHWKLVTRAFNDALNWVKDVWKFAEKWLFDPIARGIKDVISYIKSDWSGIEKYLIDPVKAAVDFILRIIGDVSNAIGGVLKSVSGLTSNNGLFGKALHFFGFAGGGITGAASGGVRSGLTLVGERGAELISVPAGSRVYNNGQTQRMLAGGGGAQPIVLQVVGGGSGLDQMFFTWLQNGIRVRGGDPAIINRRLT